MSKRHWFRFWMAKYLDGVRGLSDELGFAYTRLFVKMYENEGPLRFDEQQLKFLLEKRPQDVRRIVASLVALGKLSVDKDGFIHNGRTDAELLSAGKWDGNEGVISGSSIGKMKPHSNGHNTKKANENYPRTRDPARGYARPEPERDTDTSIVIEVSRSPLPPNDPAPPEDVSVARDLGITPSTSPAPDRPQPVYRRRNDWDLPPTPGPIGETAFLKCFAAFKAGDASAIDPLPSIPNRSANPALTARIRQQLGLDYSVEDLNAQPQADQDDDDVVLYAEPTQDLERPSADEAGTPLGRAASAAGDDPTEHADPEEPHDAEPINRPSDDDIRDFLKF